MLDTLRSRPLLIAASLYAVLMALYQVVLTPLLPEDFRRYDLRVGATIRSEGLPRPINAIGDPQAADVLVVGDSRVQQGIASEELEGAGLGRVAILWAGGAQSNDLLTLVREFPGRKLVIGLSPVAVYLEAANLLPVPEPAFTERVDRWTRQRARALHRENVRMIETGSWSRRWFPGQNTKLYDGRYRRFLRPETRATRDANFARMRDQLRALRAEGWSIACVRLPLADSLYRVEDAAFPARRFEELCRDLDVPYLDHASEPYATYDGSHLTARESLRYSVDLGGELAKLPGWAPR